MSQDIVESLKKNKALEKLWLRNNTWECSCNAVYLKNYLIEVNNFKVRIAILPLYFESFNVKLSF